MYVPTLLDIRSITSREYVRQLDHKYSHVFSSMCFVVRAPGARSPVLAHKDIAMSYVGSRGHLSVFVSYFRPSAVTLVLFTFIVCEIVEVVQYTSS